MTRFVIPGGVTRFVFVASMVVFVGCSSMNTGTSDGDGAERTCLETCEALARAGERCGLEYKRLYDTVVRDVANGDCKNVVSIRDENALRDRCLPALRTEPCANVVNRRYDESCATQLQRAASLRPPLTPP